MSSSTLRACKLSYEYLPNKRQENKRIQKKYNHSITQSVPLRNTHTHTHTYTHIHTHTHRPRCYCRRALKREKCVAIDKRLILFYLLYIFREKKVDQRVYANSIKQISIKNRITKFSLIFFYTKQKAKLIMMRNPFGMDTRTHRVLRHDFVRRVLKTAQASNSHHATHLCV